MLVWGLVTPVKSGILDTAVYVSPSVFRLGGDVMSKAYAQKHRAVSFDTVTNTQPPRAILVVFHLGKDGDMTKENKRSKAKQFGRNTFVTVATLILSTLTYFTLTMFVSKTFIFWLGTIIISIIFFCVACPKKVGKWNNSSFLIPLLIVTMIGLFDSYINNHETIKITFATQNDAQNVTNQKYKKSEKTAWSKIIKDHVREKLKDPQSAVFRNTAFSDLDGIPFLCGEVNSRNSFGGMTGYQRFIGTGANSVLIEEQSSEFHVLWDKVCR